MYKNWHIVVNRTGNTTVVNGYSDTVPVKQVTGNTIEEVKRLIEEAK